jgi:YNFM family putative membrane transporter
MSKTLRWPVRTEIFGGSLTILFIIILANFTVSTSRLVISPLVPHITDTFAVNNSMIGLALTGMWAIFAIVQFPGGIFTDRFGERRIISVALLSLGAGSIFLSISPSFILFGIFVGVLGIGSGLYFVSAVSFLSKKYTDTGGALGFHVIGSGVAGLLIPPLAAIIAIRYSWRLAVAMGAVAATPVVLLLLWKTEPTLPAQPDRPMREQFKLSEMNELFSNPGLRFTTLLAVLTYFVIQSTFSFFPTFLVEYWDFSTEIAGLGFGALALLKTVGNPIFGRLSDTLNRDFILIFCFLLSAFSYVLLLIRDSFFIAIVGVVLVGIGTAFAGVLTSRFMDDLGDSERGRGFGLANMVANLIGSLGSVVTGTIATIAGWQAAFGLLGVLFLIAATLTIGKQIF